MRRFCAIALLAALLAGCARPIAPGPRVPDSPEPPTSTPVAPAPVAPVPEIQEFPFDNASDQRIAAVSFADRQLGWLATRNRLMTTTDGGMTWTELYNHSGSIHDLTFRSAEHGLLSADDGFFESRDGGKSWLKLSEQSNTHPRLINAPCPPTGIAAFLNPDQGWVVCGAGGGAGVEAKQVYQTIDGGKTWTLIAETGPFDAPHGSMPLGSISTALFFRSALDGWLGEARGDLLVTHDGGHSWKLLAKLSLHEISAIDFLTPEQGFVVLTSRAKPVSILVTTDDGGHSWRQLYPTKK